jgi:hypothetical protein
MTAMQGGLPECDYCESTDSIVKVGDSLTCPLHRNEAAKSSNNTVTEPAPINVNEVLKQTRAIDAGITVRTDIFNSETIALDDIKKAIYADDSITNKPFALASEVHARYIKYKEVIFEHQQIINDEMNKQRAAQVYLNNLANTLRTEEREKLKISDINYKPRNVALPVNKKTIKMVKTRIDAKELRAAASELGIPEFTLKMIIIQKHLTVAQALKMFKDNIAAAKAASAPKVEEPVVTTTPAPPADEVVDMDE